MDANTTLMQKIRANYGTVIDAACKDCRLTPSFLAALIANESGGNTDAKRFEKNVLAALWEVLLGRKASYGNIRNVDLLLIMVPRSFPHNNSDSAAATAVVTYSVYQLDSLATSWGLTQVMGYHVLNAGTDWSIEKLQDPQGGLSFAIRLLGEFAKEFAINPQSDTGPRELMNCWNTGHPAGDAQHPTFDPNYATNGLARMQIYGSFGQ